MSEECWWRRDGVTGFPHVRQRPLQRYAEKTSDEVQEIAWKGAENGSVCGTGTLLLKGKLKVEVCTAVARELTGFIWAIACESNEKSVGIKDDNKNKRGITDKFKGIQNSL